MMCIHHHMLLFPPSQREKKNTNEKKMPRVWHSARNKINGCTFMRKNSVSFYDLKGIRYHIDNITGILISKSGENKQWVFVTQSSPQVPVK